MKILSADEIRGWDQYTIEHEPVSSLALMERAAGCCTSWLLQKYPLAASFSVFCGKGNNGGDGLAIARMLLEKQYPVSVYILEFGQKGTEDFQTNLARLHKYTQAGIHFIQAEENFHPLPKGEVIVDALIGSGLNRQLEGITAKLVDHINQSGCQVVAVDIPSGLFADRSSKNNITIQASHTLSFQCYKLAFLMAENENATGDVQVLDIGLHPGYARQLENHFELIDLPLIRSIWKPRKKFAHKGILGHALLVAGSYGKMGAAVLAAKACMRSGIGLLTAHIPACGYTILQTAVPEVMVLTDTNSDANTGIGEDLANYDTIGIGPGIGTAIASTLLLQDIFNRYSRPLVLDADALNCIAMQNELLSVIPAASILTPHPKEFERLFRKTDNEFDRIGLALEKAKQYGCIIVLKGHHSFIATPDGRGFFNATGNPGMATAGSGDVLTGIMTGLLAQGYSSIESAILAVYLHGAAGDFAAKSISMEAMVAGDIIKYMGEAFRAIPVRPE